MSIHLRIARYNIAHGRIIDDSCLEVIRILKGAQYE
jgi:hypothetical protein